jgi:hypothetical protein
MAASITGPYFTLRGFMNGYQLLFDHRDINIYKEWLDMKSFVI